MCRSLPPILLELIFVLESGRRQQWFNIDIRLGDICMRNPLSTADSEPNKAS